MTTSDEKKPKDKEPEVDLSQVSADDIAKRFLETPPKSKPTKQKDDK
jgi:hypothetical protein